MASARSRRSGARPSPAAILPCSLARPPSDAPPALSSCAPRTAGWALRGKRANDYTDILGLEGSYTVLAAFTLERGCIGYYIHANADGGYGGADFIHGFTLSILPELARLVQAKAPLGVACVADNWSGHYSLPYALACQQAGAVPERPPPYIPNKMVHEKCGGAAKTRFRHDVKRLSALGFTQRQQIGLAFESIGPDVVRAAAREIGYL